MARSKIEMSLSETELQAFCNKLAGTPHLTLETVRAEAAKLGISVSLMAAKTFRDGAYSAHLDKYRKARELAQQLREMGNDNAAGSLADAGAAILMQQVYDELTSGGQIDFDTFSKIISRLRSGDHQQSELAAKLKEYERRATEWERKEKEREEAKRKAIADIRNGGGLSDEALAKLEAQIGSL